MEQNIIYSTSFSAGRRTYFFDIKKSSAGDKYLNIIESKRTDQNKFERHQIMIFCEDIDKFEVNLALVLKKFREREKSYTLEEKRNDNPNAYLPWTTEDDEQLELLYCKGNTRKELSKIFGRNAGAIDSRIKKLELKEKYGS